MITPIKFLAGHGVVVSYRETGGVPYVDTWRVSFNR